MPVLNKRIGVQKLDESSGRGRIPFLAMCANSECASGWLHVWRSRTSPVIERGWCCSSGCTHARLNQLMRREGEEPISSMALHRHRIPLGLVLLEQEWISQAQLKQALDAQRAGTAARIGEWLVEHAGLEEARLTRALSIQWNCPIFSSYEVSGLPAVSPVPRLLMEAFRFFPMRLSNAGVLYIAFEDRIDHSVTLAVERITGLRVEAGLLDGSEFRRKHNARLVGRFLPTRVMEAASRGSLLQALTNLIEKERPLDTQIVRIHDFYWLRLWKESMRPGDPPFVPFEGTLDVVCSIGALR
jgi:Type II secretion system (T2SS), protein E, N-terminal domain